MKQHNDFATLGRVLGRAMNASGFVFTHLKSRLWLKSLMLLCLILPFSALATIPTAAGIKPQMSSPTMRLMENKGQVTDLEGNPRPDVLFLGQNGGMKVAVRPTGISFQFEKQETAPTMEPGRAADFKDFEKPEPTLKETYRLDLDLVGSNATPQITRGTATGYYENYYNTPDAPDGILEVQSYSKITLIDVYPGIDWVIYSHEGGLKYDFIVHPGADPHRIRMQYKGATASTLLEDGKLKLATPMGEITEDAPVSFSADGAPVGTQFKLLDGELTFELGRYDSMQTLVIDPALAWASYYGGGADDNVSRITSFGNSVLYLAGMTSSTNGISMGGHQNTIGGYWDGFVAKFDTNGNRIWATYYGGFDFESGSGVATDLLGNVYLSGISGSSFGIASGGHQNTMAGNHDAYLVKFNAAGIRVWGTYYGGTGLDGGQEVATDPLGNVYLTGNGSSTSGIAAGGYQNTLAGGSDAYLVKFNAAGVRIWGTYFGGSQNEVITRLETDATGNVYAAGFTESASGIATGGHQTVYGGNTDLFVAKFDALGALLWSTYYGDTSLENYPDLALDQNANVYLAGQTRSPTNFASGGHQNQIGGRWDAILVKFNSAGIRLWGTYYGDTMPDYGTSVCTDAASNVYLGGHTQSNRFIASGGYQNVFPGYLDSYIVKFGPAGNRIWGTYFGFPYNTYIYGLHAINNYSIFILGNTTIVGGMTGPHQTVFGGGTYDAFLAKITQGPCTPPAPATGAVHASHCSGTPIPPISVAIPGLGDTILWYTAAVGGSIATGTVLGTRGNSFLPSNPATFTYYAETNRTSLPCSTGTRRPVTLTQLPSPTVMASSNSPVCQGGTLTLAATPNIAYSWSGPLGFTSNIQFPSISNFAQTHAGNYTVTVTSPNGCTATSTVTVAFLATPATPSAPVNASYCTGTPIPILAVNAPPVGQMIYWFTAPTGGAVASGTISGIRGNNFRPTSGATATYYAEAWVTSVGCISPARTPVTLTLMPSPSAAASSNTPVCEGDTLFLTANGGNTYAWTGPNGFSSTLQNPILGNVAAAMAGAYMVTVTSGNGCNGSTTITVATLPTAIANFNFVQNPGNGLDYTFTDVSTGTPTTWAWDFGDGNTSNLQNPTHTYAASGNYVVQLIVADSCGSDTISQSIAVVGFSEMLDRHIALFPNPNHGDFHLEASGLSGWQASVEITNVHGQTLAQWSPTLDVGKLRLAISLDPAATGVYFVKIADAEGVVVKKLVIR